MSNRTLFAALFLAAAPALAGNLLPNPTFDSGFAGWAYVGTGTWNASDALAQAGSGSALGTNSAATPFTYETVLVSACLPVVPGASYDGSFDYRIPTGQGVTSVPSLEIAWYSGAGCGGGSYLSSNMLVDGTLVDGAWHRAESTYAPTAPANATFASFRVHLSKIEAGGTATAYYDNIVWKPQGTCGTTPDRLCLNNDRFQVTSTFQTYASVSGVGMAQAMTPDTGYFWFFSPANVEVVIKVINGCSYNSNYWIYAGGLTDVYVRLEVTDTQTGVSQVYTNPLGTPFHPIGDIGSFATCP